MRKLWILAAALFAVPAIGQVQIGSGVQIGSAGSGTVTTFSATSIVAPFFTTSVANATTTPALTFTVDTQTANCLFAGPTSGSAATPTCRALVNADFPNTLAPVFSAANLTSFPTFNQNTTGTAANLSGTPALPNGTTATTQTTGDNTTKLATDAFVIANAGGGITQLTGDVTAGPGSGSQASTVVKINGDAVPASATVLGSNSSSQLVSASTTGSGSVALSISPTFTGTPAAPTAVGGTNTTQLATTAFVQAAIAAAGTGAGIVTYSGPSLTPSGTLYFPIGGGGLSSTTETNVDIDSPAAVTIQNMTVQMSAAPGLGNSIVYTWRKNASSTVLTCTISGASATSCSDTTHSFTTASLDLLDIQVVTTGTIVGAPTIIMAAQVGVSATTSTTFSAISTGTNTSAAMTVGSGASLAPSGTGTVSANQLNGVPFCTGFTPTTGQSLQYTTGSSPNPCYTAASSSGGPSYSLTADTNIAAGTGVSVNSAGHAQQTWGPAPNIAGVVTLAAASQFGSSYQLASSLIALSSTEYVGWTTNGTATSVVAISKSGTTLTVGTPNTSISPNVYFIIPLTSSTFILVDGDTNAYVGTISGGAIIFGSPLSATTALNGYALSSTSFVITQSGGTIVVGTVSGTSISLGTPQTLGSGSFNNNFTQIEVLSSTLVVALFGDSSNSNILTAIPCIILGSSITPGSATTLSGSVVGVLSSPGVLSSSAFVVEYAPGYSNGGPTYAVVATVSGTVTFGTPVFLSGASAMPTVSTNGQTSPFIPLAVVSSSKVALSASGTIPQIASVSGTTLTVPSTIIAPNSGFATPTFPQIVESSNLISNSVVAVGSDIMAVDTSSNVYEIDQSSNVSPSIQHPTLTSYGLTAADSTTAVAWFSDWQGNFQARVITYESINPTPPIGISAAGATSGNPVTITPVGSVSGLSGLTPGTEYYYNGDGTITNGNTGHPAGVALTSSTLAVQ